MYLLLMAATRLELLPTLRYLEERVYMRHHHRIEVLFTGVGLMNATYALTRNVLRDKPDMVLQAGVAGSFHTLFPPGKVVCVKEEVLADLGVEESGSLRSLFDMKLQEPNEHPFAEGRLVNPHQHLLDKCNCPAIRAASVNEVTTRPERIREIQRVYRPAIESMEGAALHYVCLQEGIPFLQLRAVSNMVGERNKAHWKMAEAVHNLNQQLIVMLNRCSGSLLQQFP